MWKYLLKVQTNKDVEVETNKDEEDRLNFQGLFVCSGADAHEGRELSAKDEFCT